MRKLIQELMHILQKTSLIFIIAFISSAYALEPVADKPDGYSVPALRSESVLKSSVGVRSYGMGEAQVGRSDDLSSLYYNVAGLSTMRYWEYGLSYSAMGLDVGGVHGLLAAPLPYGTLGFRFSLYSVRNTYQVKYGKRDHPDRNKYAYLTQLSYALPVYRKILHTGLTVKYQQSELSSAPDASPPYYQAYPKRERGLYFDWGFLATYDLSELEGFWFWWPKVSAGVSVRNMQPKFGFDNEAKGISPQVNTGISFYYSYKFMINFDTINEIDEPTRFQLGFELWPIYFLAIRSGFMASDSPLKGFYWGVGIGESIGSSKFSFEYAGNVRTYNEFRTLTETYHRIAFHQSFERVFRFVDSKGRKRQIKIAQTERYNTPLQFAYIIDPNEIIDTAAELAKQQTDHELENEIKKEPDTTTTTTTTGGEQGGETEEQKKKKRPVIIRKKTVAFYPIVVQPPVEDPGIKALRRAIIRGIIAHKKIKPMSEIRYKLNPRKESGEDQITYLNRLCKFHNVNMVILSYGRYNEADDSITLEIQFYKRGSKTINGLLTKRLYKGNTETKIDEIKNEVLLQIGSIL
ncbi:MAG: hypothetical protein D6767_08525, partial [Candidatus Hydrogenedentota bacterium]